MSYEPYDPGRAWEDEDAAAASAASAAEAEQDQFDEANGLDYREDRDAPDAE